MRSYIRVRACMDIWRLNRDNAPTTGKENKRKTNDYRDICIELIEGCNKT